MQKTNSKTIIYNTTLIILILLGIFFFVKNSLAADIYATGCTPAQIQAAINTAQSSSENDNTVHIPACDDTTNWQYNYITGPPSGHEYDYADLRSSSVTKKLRLLGAGKGVTKIKYFLALMHPTNLVEWGNMTVYGLLTDTWNSHQVIANAGAVTSSFGAGTEIYWHDLEIYDYASNQIADFYNTYGVVTRSYFRGYPCSSWPGCQDSYAFYINGWTPYDKTTTVAKSGTRNAMFFEDNEFHIFVHTTSGFCNAYVVFRYNKLYLRASGIMDNHGPGYQGCGYSNGWDTSHGDGGGGGEFYENELHQLNDFSTGLGQGNGWIGSRSGSSMLVFNNKLYADGFTPPLMMVTDYVDKQCGAEPGDLSYGQSQNCGTGSGQTCNRKYAWQTPGNITDGCFSLHEEIHVWGNSSVGYTQNAYLWRIGDHVDPQPCEDCIRWGVELFTAAPTGYTPYTYPHPLTLGITPPPDTTPPAAPTGVAVS